MTDPSRIRVSGPLEAFAAGFADELSRQGYTPNSARLQMHLMAHLSRWLAGEGLDAHRLCATGVERFLGARRAAGYTNRLTGQAMRPMLTYLRGLGVAPMPPAPAPNGPVEVALERYRHYLTGERGLGRTTARGYVDAVRPFLRGRVSPDGLDLNLAQLSAADVTAFVVATCPHQARVARRS